MRCWQRGTGGPRGEQAEGVKGGTCRRSRASLDKRVKPGAGAAGRQKGTQRQTRAFQAGLPERRLTMRFMVMVRADKNSEAGVMPSRELLTAMGKFNEDLVNAGVMLA